MADVRAGYGTYNPDDGDTPNALIACDEKNALGYDDWYLPAYDELDALYDNQTAIGGFGSGWYWSSTELGNSTEAQSQRFSDGQQDGNRKYENYSVRCIRQ